MCFYLPNSDTIADEQEVFAEFLNGHAKLVGEDLVTNQTYVEQVKLLFSHSQLAALLAMSCYPRMKSRITDKRPFEHMDKMNGKQHFQSAPELYNLICEIFCEKYNFGL
jgi:hypothetical protein